MKKRLIIVLCLLIYSNIFGNLVLHISPADLGVSGDGTYANPYSTFENVLERIENEISNGLMSDIYVILHDGIYELSNPIEIGPEHSNGNYDIYFKPLAGANPVLSGGITLPKTSNYWTQIDTDKWEFDLNGLSKWLNPIKEIRELYVSNKRYKRATDNQYYTVNHLGAITDEVYIDNLPSSINPNEGAEILIFHDWNILRSKIVSVSQDKVKAQSSLQGNRMIDKYGGFVDCLYTIPKKLVQFENVKAFLDEQQEWHFDYGASKLTIFFENGKDPFNSDIIIPNLKQTVKINGTNNNYVNNVSFENITFSFTSWRFSHLNDNGFVGFPGIQGDYFSRGYFDTNAKKYIIPPSIQIKYGNSIKFISCNFRGIGNTALAFGAGCINSSVENCTFQDIGASGINVGMQETNESDFSLTKGPGSDWDFPYQIPTNIIIENCDISDCANQYMGSAGIWIQYSQRVRVSSNKIYNLPLTGISIGYSFSYIDNSMKDNIIENNEIYDVVNRLADYAGIYVNGQQHGTIIRNNYIHDIVRNPYATTEAIGKGGSPVAGIFFDESCTNVFVEDNVIENVWDNRDGPNVFTPTRYNKCTRSGIVFKDFLLNNINIF